MYHRSIHIWICSLRIKSDPSFLLGTSSRRSDPLGGLGCWVQFWSGWEEGALGILKGPRITSRAPSQTQSGRGESVFVPRGNLKGRRGPVAFWLDVENPNHHQK